MSINKLYFIKATGSWMLEMIFGNSEDERIKVGINNDTAFDIIDGIHCKPTQIMNNEIAVYHF